jgi:hypothetical protein
MSGKSGPNSKNDKNKLITIPRWRVSGDASANAIPVGRPAPVTVKHYPTPAESWGPLLERASFLQWPFLIGSVSRQSPESLCKHIRAQFWQGTLGAHCKHAKTQTTIFTSRDMLSGDTPNSGWEGSTLHFTLFYVNKLSCFPLKEIFRLIHFHPWVVTQNRDCLYAWFLSVFLK